MATNLEQQQQQLYKLNAELANLKRQQSLAEQQSKGGLLKKPDLTSVEGKRLLAKFKEASKLVKAKQKEYNDLEKIVNAAVEKSKVVSEEGSNEEALKAAAQGLTVEELRAKTQAALEKKKQEEEAANQSVTDQKEQATYSQFINTLVADETQLKAVQEDLARNFPAYYKGGSNGLKDWLKTQAAIEAIYTDRGKLPKALQATDLRTFLIKPPVEGFGTSAGTGGPTIRGQVADDTTADAYVKDAFKTNLNREPSPEELAKYRKILQDKQRKSPYKTSNGITTGGINEGEFLSQELQKLPEFSTKKKEKDTLTTQSLQSIARANGINLSADQLTAYADEIRNGKDINVIKNTIRNSAGLGMPDNIKKMLADGTDLETIYSPYKQTMASLLEINPVDISLDDSTLRSAIGPDKEMPLYEFRKALKKDARWQYTNNARAEVSDKVLRVLQDFGFQG